MKLFTENYNDWVNLAKSYVGENFCRDIVHEAYIKLHSYNKEVNRSYIFLTIRSLCFDFLKEKNKYIKEECEDVFIDESEDYDDYFDIMGEKIEKEMKNWHWYDALLFNIYRHENISLRELSKRTGISLTSTHYTIKNCKNLLKKNINGQEN